MSSDLAARRAAVLGPNVPTFYETPVHLVKGDGVWLWDADGRKYLDCYNNVPHVGHCHPHVVSAIAAQAAQRKAAARPEPHSHSASHTAQWLILHNSLHQANVVAVVTGAAAVVMTRQSG